MQELINEIYRLAKNSLLDNNLIIGEDVLSSIKEGVERFVNLSKKSNKKELLSMSNMEIFSIFIRIENYELPYYDELENILLDYRDVINNWTFLKEGRTIYNIIFNRINRKNVDDLGNLEIISQLGISSDLMQFSLIGSLQAVYTFLRFKHEVEKTTKSNLSRGIFATNDLKARIEDKAFTNSGMAGLVNAAIECLNSSLVSEKKKRDNTKNKIKATKELIKVIEDGKLAEITAIPNNWHQYLDVDILEELYNLIHINLLKDYKEVIASEKEFCQAIEASPLKKYLISKQLDYDSLDEKTKNKIENISEVVRKIQVLENLGLDINVILLKYVDCLIDYDDEKIKFLNSLINVGALKRDTIVKYFKLIMKDKYEIIRTNYMILKDIIDFNNIFYKDNLLFINSHIIRNIISVLREYNLTRNNYMFLLCNYRFILIYDLMLEHDIPEELLISICHTKNPIDTIKRIIIFKSIGESYETDGHRLRKNVTDSNRVFGSEELDNYLDNIVPSIILDSIHGDRIDDVMKNDIVREIDERYRNGDVYIIGNTRISRNKFLRNYQSRMDTKYLVSCLVSDSIMSSGEYFSLYNEVNRKLILTK